MFNLITFYSYISAFPSHVNLFSGLQLAVFLICKVSVQICQFEAICLILRKSVFICSLFFPLMYMFNMPHGDMLVHK